MMNEVRFKKKREIYKRVLFFWVYKSLSGEIMYSTVLLFKHTKRFNYFELMNILLCIFLFKREMNNG